MSKLTKKVFLVGIVLTVYGYLCRIIGLYFFWESKYIGWSIILVAIIIFLFNRIRIKKAQARKSILEKIGIGILIFILLIQIAVLAVIPNSNAYKAATQYLRRDTKIVNEIGDIEGFSLIPLGGLQVNSAGDQEWGNANINIIVKGRLKFKDVSISLTKNPGAKWIVVDVK